MACMVNAQVIISDGDTNVPGYDTRSVLLGFGDKDNSGEGVNKGIILPMAEKIWTAGGSFLVDKDDLNAVVMWEGRNGGGWVPLTRPNDLIEDSFRVSGTVDVGEGVIIGADQSSKRGVLVLESIDKTLVLPRVYKPHENMKNAIAGTICYDTSVDMLAVYDGQNWHYWK